MPPVFQQDTDNLLEVWRDLAKAAKDLVAAQEKVNAARIDRRNSGLRKAVIAQERNQRIREHGQVSGVDAISWVAAIQAEDYSEDILAEARKHLRRAENTLCEAAEKVLVIRTGWGEIGQLAPDHPFLRMADKVSRDEPSIRHIIHSASLGQTVIN